MFKLIFNIPSRYFCRNASTYSSILVSQKGTNNDVGLIQFNRPKSLNALCNDLMNDIRNAMVDFDKSDNIKCIILTGNERAFAAGADIKEMFGKTYGEVFGTNFLADWDAVSHMKKPVIAAVDGYALGGGCELAMMCDIIYASDRAKFGQPEIKLGTIPGAGGTQRFTKALGKSRAMEYALTGDMISAQQAEAWGLVSKVLPSAELVPGAIKLAEKISKMSPLAVKAAKEAILASFNTTLDEGCFVEKRLFYGTFGTEDCKEGMGAFVEKREANFKGK